VGLQEVDDGSHEEKGRCSYHNFPVEVVPVNATTTGSYPTATTFKSVMQHSL
jgi:hypothetical protein